MGRLVRMPDHTQLPILSSAAARVATRDLEQQGWEVNFYLGGRELLNFQDTHGLQATLPKNVSALPRDLRGPVPLMPIAQQAAPKRQEVVAQAKLALEAAAPSGYRSRVGEWNLVAYPVTATKIECVSCHNSAENRRQLGRSPKIGDVLGVTIYAYRRAKSEG